MGYKAYYEEYLLFEREAKDASAQCVKYQKAVAKDMSKGDFKSAARNAASLALSGNLG